MVLHKLNSAVKLIQRTTNGGSSMTTMNYIELDVHKDDQLLREGREWPDTAGRQDWSVLP